MTDKIYWSFIEILPMFLRENGASVEVSLKAAYLPRDFTPEEFVYNEQLKEDLGKKAVAIPLHEFVTIKN